MKLHSKNCWKARFIYEAIPNIRSKKISAGCMKLNILDPRRNLMYVQFTSSEQSQLEANAAVI